MEQIINEENPANIITADESVSLRLAGFWVRFWSYLIDLALIGMISHILFRIIWPAGLEQTGIQSFVLINPLFPGIIGALYFVIMTAVYGQTLGKMIFGIKVIGKDGRPPGWKTALIRELAGRTVSQLMGSHLGYLVCAFHPQKQGLHDILSDTLVVYNSLSKGKWVQVPRWGIQG